MTGASSGIGLALCKLLVRDHGCHVYLGARNATKGAACLKDILAEVPAAAGKIELLTIDVTDDASVAAAAASLKAKGVTLYGLVNNAGVGLAQPGAPNGPEAILATNLYGVKRVSEAMLTLLDPSEGRIVNTSSGVASGFVKTQDAALKALFSGEGLTMETLEASIKACVASGNVGIGNGYGISKAALSAYTIIQARQYPALTVASISPGFIDTPMTQGFGARLTPEQGCVSALKCLFEPVTSGFYYGSDGVRAPNPDPSPNTNPNLTLTRIQSNPNPNPNPNPK